MGKNLANEVKFFLIKKPFLAESRISFLGFSMGGIIIRAALPYLD